MSYWVDLKVFRPALGVWSTQKLVEVHDTQDWNQGPCKNELTVNLDQLVGTGYNKFNRTSLMTAQRNA